MQIVAQHNFKEDLWRIVDESDLVLHDIKQCDLSEVDCGETSNRFKRVESQVRLLMQAKELQQRHWCTVSQKQQKLSHVGLQLVLALCKC